jgi:hypothetical protein
MKEACEIHDKHSHAHGPNCGHTSLKHNGHTDYLHDGHMHHVHADHIDEHKLEVSDANRDRCTPEHKCGDHAADHHHGPNCGHEAVPHGNHTDYLVKDHLHHPHGAHCDDHGRVDVSARTAASSD